MWVRTGRFEELRSCEPRQTQTIEVIDGQHTVQEFAAVAPTACGFAATRRAKACGAPSARSSRYMVVPRFHCLSFGAHNRWRSHSSSSRQTLGVCVSPKWAFQLIKYGRTRCTTLCRLCPPEQEFSCLIRSLNVAIGLAAILRLTSTLADAHRLWPRNLRPNTLPIALLASLTSKAPIPLAEQVFRAV